MQKILFNKLLLPSVLDGTKTMTRRIIKSNDADSDYDVVSEYNAYMGDLLNIGVDGIPCSYPSLEDYCIGKYSRYHIGEIAAVAQSYNDIYEELKRTYGSSSSITRDFFHKYIQGGRMPVSNKMFVKAEAMPHQIQITDIKVERLQDISIFDTLREGIRAQYSHEVDMNVYDFANCKKPHHTPRDAFAELIDKVSGKGTWERNPWVFAYSFELACASFAQRQ